MIFYVGEYGGLEEVAIAIGHSATTAHQFSTVANASLAVFVQFVEVRFVVLWTMRCRTIQWITDFHAFDVFHYAPYEIIMDFVFDE